VAMPATYRDGEEGLLTVTVLRHRFRAFGDQLWGQPRRRTRRLIPRNERMRNSRGETTRSPEAPAGDDVFR
jgi:hypothetical protein